jgi:tRNA threonylcarbamoyladenosine biosynthesis protein TsaB
MVLVAADTSGKHGSVALVRADVDGRAIRNFQSLEVVSLAGGTFSAELVPQISGLLQRHSIKKSEVDGFVVISGPGSFTGLRVGLAAIKGLAEVLGKPIAAISLLEVLARAANHKGRVWSAIDAGRHEVYLGDYDFLKDDLCVTEQLIAQEELVATVRSNLGSIFVTPDKIIAALLEEHALPVLAVEWPRSDFIARVGMEKIMAGKTVSPGDLDANYIRRSDAEIFSKPRSQ